MKNLLLAIAFTFSASILFAQQFESAVGLRLGYPTSASYKKFISEDKAVEAYVGFRDYFGSNWLSVNAAYQTHKDLEFEDIQGLQWYYGFGAGLNRVSYEFDRGGYTFFNLSGYVGLSYVFEDIPLNLSVDWVPSIFVGGGGVGRVGGFGGGYGALTARYVLHQD